MVRVYRNKSLFQFQDRENSFSTKEDAKIAVKKVTDDAEVGIRSSFPGNQIDSAVRHLLDGWEYRDDAVTDDSTIEEDVDEEVVP